MLKANNMAQIPNLIGDSVYMYIWPRYLQAYAHMYIYTGVIVPLTKVPTVGTVYIVKRRLYNE